MASPLPTAERPAVAARIEVPAGPARGSWWWIGALASPVFAVALIASLDRPLDADRNERLESAGRLISWGSSDFSSFLEHAYPPIPVAVAALMPGGAFWLAVPGALVAGVLLNALRERLAQREIQPWLTAVLLVAFVANPAFLQLAHEDLADFIGVGLVVLALIGFLQFAVDGDTHGGFVCGLSLGLAAACTPVTLIYTVFFGLAAGPVARLRSSGEPHSVPAAALVIVFPAAGAFLGWTFLQWRFTGEPLGWIEAAAPGVGTMTAEQWRPAAKAVALALAASPLFLLTQVWLMRRRISSALVTALVVLALAAGLGIGLRQPSGYSTVLLGAIALTSIPARPTAEQGRMLVATAITGLCLTWLWAAQDGNEIGPWATALFS